jgi:molybdopterin synthase catalytic subunit
MIEITYDALDLNEIVSRVAQDSNGAIVTFLGTTRNHTANRKVLFLEYEAYRPMADKQLAVVAAEIREKWQVQDVAISHRLGRLEIGEASLAVAVASPHREVAFEACQYSIDRIKQIVPIWKKEFFEGGEVWVGSQEDQLAKEAATSTGSTSR